MRNNIYVFERIAFLSLFFLFFFKNRTILFFEISDKIESSRIFASIRKRNNIERITWQRYMPNYQFNQTCNSEIEAIKDVEGLYSVSGLSNIEKLFNVAGIGIGLKKELCYNLANYYRYDLFLREIQKYYHGCEIKFFLSNCGYIVKKYGSLLRDIEKEPYYKIKIVWFYYYCFKVTSFLYLITVFSYFFTRCCSLLFCVRRKRESGSCRVAYRLYPGEVVNNFCKRELRNGSQRRTYDFLKDDDIIKDDDILFCIEGKISQKKTNDINSNMKIAQPYSTKKNGMERGVFFDTILLYLRVLCNIANIDFPFHIWVVMGVRERMVWSQFVRDYSVNNYVVFNDLSSRSVIRNSLLKEAGIKIYFFNHSSHNTFEWDTSTKSLLHPVYGFHNVTDMVCHGRRMEKFFMKYSGEIKRFHTYGVPWSENVKKSKEKPSDGILRLLQTKKKYKYFIGVFDTSFGFDHTDIAGASSLQVDDIVAFYSGILDLAGKYSDCMFLLKPKNYTIIPDEYYKINVSDELIDLKKQLEDCKRVEIFNIDMDSREIISICDLNIASCFTSIVSESLGARVKAIYYDGSNKNQDTPWGKIPNMVPNSSKSLCEAVEYWMNLSEEGFARFIKKYIIPEVDPYCDGQALNRFRKQLMNV